MSRQPFATRSFATRLFAAVAGLGLGLAGTADAQEPGGQVGGPVLANPAQRSGVISRHMPIIPRLPHDPDRDDFYQTRRGDEPATRPNLYKTSGLYGLPMKGDCTVAFSPYFSGSPGGCYGPNCTPVNHRVVNNFLHPWRPVSQYYSGGVYAPVYDLDPIVPGPGPFPWPFMYHRQPMGG